MPYHGEKKLCSFDHGILASLDKFMLPRAWPHIENDCEHMPEKA